MNQSTDLIDSPSIYTTLACNLDGPLLRAALPLFAAEQIEAIEWSFDTLYQKRNIPEWFLELLKAYGKAGRLVGHGVFFSIFSGRWSTDQAKWLAELKRKAAYFQFDHVTEHFGFMTGTDFHKGAPIGVPMTDTTLAIGRDRLRRIQDAAQCPVGLENLAFAYSLEEVEQHGTFLRKLIEPVNGFIILDLHNVYCQLHNFEINPEAIFQLYPLDRVREIHVSGGSWVDSSTAPAQKVRRDTHDEAVPEEVFQLLQMAIPQCPNLKYVVLEQMGSALHDKDDQIQFQKDFQRIRYLIQQAEGRGVGTNRSASTFTPLSSNEPLPEVPVSCESLHQQQRTLAQVLETARDTKDAFEQLSLTDLASSAWSVENWHPHMLETAMQIAQKWKGGWE